MNSSANSRSPAKPFSGKKQLYNVIQVQHNLSFVRHDYDARELLLRPGDPVVVDAGSGPVLGQVIRHSARELRKPNSLKPVMRKANARDLQSAADAAEREKEAYRFAIQRIRSRNLPMKLIRVQSMLDSSRMVFFFAAEGRVDFRNLVKDLAHQYRMRIEMHQIGVRDGTRMIGGIGSCGRELCCSTFLEKFAPVSIRMAKEQGLSLNPQKVSGMCGRLMCCLVYEQKTYKRLRRKLPKAGRMVETAKGTAKVLSLDVLNQKVRVAYPDTSVQMLGIDEVRKKTPQAEEDAEWSKKEPSYIWDEILRAAGDEEKRSGRRRRRGRRRSSDRPPNDTSDTKARNTSPKESSQAGPPAEGDPQKRRRRRRRRGGKGPAQGASAGKEGSAKSAEKRPENKKRGEQASADGAPKRRRRRRRRGKGGGGGGNAAQGNAKPKDGSAS